MYNFVFLLYYNAVGGGGGEDYGISFGFSVASAFEKELPYGSTARETCAKLPAFLLLRDAYLRCYRSF